MSLDERNIKLVRRRKISSILILFGLVVYHKKYTRSVPTPKMAIWTLKATKDYLKLAICNYKQVGLKKARNASQNHADSHGVHGPRQTMVLVKECWNSRLFC